jgi:hypothetical protein
MKRKRSIKEANVDYFMEWFEENRDKFNPRLIVKRTKDHIIARYKGIIPEIVVGVYDNNISIDAEYRGFPYETLVCFDILLNRDKKGQYYCEMCVDDHRKFYNSSREIYYEHNFDAFLEWSNEKIKDDNFLLIAMMGRSGGSTWAQIVKPEGLKRCCSSANLKKHLVAILSLKKIKGYEL